MTILSTHLENQNTDPSLTALIQSITVCCADIADLLKHGPMNDILGMAGAENVQGEDQKKLDVISNDMLKEALANTGLVKAIASEEEEHCVPSDPDGKFLVLFDPLDGSSNIDINSLVGTIFSIYAAPEKETIEDTDFLIAGRKQLAAGYVLYGPSVILTLTTGHGTHMYMLDQNSNAFLLFVDGVQIPRETKEFAINAANQRHWAEPMQLYISDLLKGETGPRQKNFNMRWVAAMVGDVHRILCRGGLFTYPWDKKDPDKAGKLRLMYEANPMALLTEQAGGAAFTDELPILDIDPEHIHQRVPVILGSSEEVNICVNYHR
ncbi:MAG: class 1 fructose-bisphosphatase [Hellea sp.]|nr:class 1 fructose-bisphosphatase [Hellea sp.]